MMAKIMFILTHFRHLNYCEQQVSVNDNVFTKLHHNSPAAGGHMGAKAFYNIYFIIHSTLDRTML